MKIKTHKAPRQLPDTCKLSMFSYCCNSNYTLMANIDYSHGCRTHSGGAGVQNQIVWLQSPCFYIL